MNEAAVMGAVCKFASTVDGSIRITVEIDEIYTREALEALCEVGVQVAMVRASDAPEEA